MITVRGAGGCIMLTVSVLRCVHCIACVINKTAALALNSVSENLSSGQMCLWFNFLSLNDSLTATMFGAVCNEPRWLFCCSMRLN